ncbi:biosynthetic arginine decarboxylase [Myxococcota bacterium]|nr:biosynthetic arginine decarboxylase [Myxococcota bacterium]
MSQARKEARSPTARVDEAAAYYEIDNWGAGYFRVSAKGEMCAHPDQNGSGVSLLDVVGLARDSGLRPPLLVRFPQILHQQVRRLNHAFGRAIDEYGYTGRYHGVYPIKVNQDAYVVQAIVEEGRRHGYGIEAGSKPELVVALAQDLPPEALIICNGYKDLDYIRLALAARGMGRQVFLIVEKPSEVTRIAEAARAMDVRPLIGIRLKLQSRGSGKWEKSGGAAAKFGLTVTELLGAIEQLRGEGMLDCLQLLHFHIGSQITQIRRIRDGVREAARAYAKLQRMGCGVRFLDVGGGLGVDYDGSRTSFESSINYSLEEYANTVVWAVKEVCESEEVQVPHLVSESGRAVAAYHSLVVLEVSPEVAPPRPQIPEVPEEDHSLVHQLHDLAKEITRKNYREFYHDATDLSTELDSLFKLGYISLEERSRAERLTSFLHQRIIHHAREESPFPEEFEALEEQLSVKYVCNFSVFQSVPDYWAVGQLFPVVPLHRLKEPPTVNAQLTDITCDSDGCISKFPDVRDVKDFLKLHPLRPGEPYYLGVFLTGAYQDVLGDFHNMFGTVDEVIVRVDEEGAPQIDAYIKGQTARDVLSLFGFDVAEMVDDYRTRMRDQARRGEIDEFAAEVAIAQFSSTLDSYTYLRGE